MNEMIEKVDARLKEIVTAVETARKQIENLTSEYNQLIGYKQAIKDLEQVNASKAIKDLEEGKESQATGDE